MTTTGVKVTTRGRFFTNAPREVRQSGNAIVKELVKLGEQRLALTLRPRPGGVFLSVSQAGRGKASTGHYRRNLHTVVRELHGRIDDGGVIYGPWLERGRAGTRFRGYASFRRVGQWMQKQLPRIARVHMSRLSVRVNS